MELMRTIMQESGVWTEENRYKVIEQAINF